MKKHFFTILALAFALSISAQEYTYSVTQNEAGLFTLDVTTELSDTRQSIDRNTDLDSASLQLQQYARIEQAYNEIAAAEQRRLAALRKINTLRASLASVGLYDFNAYQFARYDSTFVTDNARWARSGQTTELAYIQYREGSTQVLRSQEDNRVLGVILPLSPNYIRLNIPEAERIGAAAGVFMSSANSRDFRGSDEEGNSYFLRILR